MPVMDELPLVNKLKPKEKIWFISSENLTIGLIAIFVIASLIGILFLSSKGTSDSQNESLPMPSASSALSNLTQAKEVPATLPPKTQLGPTVPSVKPSLKPTPTPTPSPTTSPSTATNNPTPSPTSSSAPKVVNLSMSPATSSISNASEITINLIMDTGSGKANAADIHLNFDATKLQVQSFTAGSFLPVVLSSPTYDNSAGTASITLGSSPGSAASGTGTLATLVFKTTNTGSASVSYNSSTQTADSGVTNLNSTSGSTITIN